MRRLILGNLLFEEELARRSTPPRTVLETASRAATLLRAFAREGDRLWTPAPVAPESLPEIPGLPWPVLESGPLEKLAPADEVLAWAEAPEAAALRGSASCRGGSGREEGGSTRPGNSAPSRTGRVEPPPHHPDPPLREDSRPLHELLWRLPAPPPAAVAAANHRAFCLQVAADLGCALPGARMLDSLADLDRLLASPEAPPAWVLKAPLSASGRSRHIERDAPPLQDPKARRAVERLFERHGPLLFEPWMDRVDDFGVSVLLTAAEARTLSFHRQLVDRKGQFAGIELPGRFEKIDLPEGDRERLEEVVEGVARALRRAGYAGPFGIDLWRYRRPDGAVVLHPLGEINARMTFGLVARALVDRVRGELGIGEEATVRLDLSSSSRATISVRGFP